MSDKPRLMHSQNYDQCRNSFSDFGEMTPIAARALEGSRQ
jgi:hypothetical protein